MFSSVNSIQYFANSSFNLFSSFSVSKILKILAGAFMNLSFLNNSSYVFVTTSFFSEVESGNNKIFSYFLAKDHLFSLSFDSSHSSDVQSLQSLHFSHFLSTNLPNSHANADHQTNHIPAINQPNAHFLPKNIAQIIPSTSQRAPPQLLNVSKIASIGLFLNFAAVSFASSFEEIHKDHFCSGVSASNSFKIPFSTLSDVFL